MFPRPRRLPTGPRPSCPRRRPTARRITGAVVAVVAGLVAGPLVGIAPEASAATARVAVATGPDEVRYAPGDTGRAVRVIQARLRQIGWFSGDVTGYYGPRTRAAVSGFQAKRGIPVTGTVTRRTLTLLEGMTRTPTAAELANRDVRPGTGARLDRRCLTGRVLCVDKTSRTLRWVVDGKVGVDLDARFGASATPTREGRFTVYLKSRDHVSSLYGSSMPFAMFFSGGQAIHYSPDFAARGYAGASHGCVNIRDYAAIARLFDRVRVGDTVVVYRS